jgi:hypothetical protein
LGLVLIALAAVITYPFVYQSYAEALRKTPRIMYHPSAVGLTAMFGIVGTVYLVAGASARHFMPFGSLRNLRLIQWIVLIVVTLAVVAIAGAYEQLFVQMGYEPRVF